MVFVPCGAETHSKSGIILQGVLQGTGYGAPGLGSSIASDGVHVAIAYTGRSFSSAAGDTYTGGVLIGSFYIQASSRRRLNRSVDVGSSRLRFVPLFQAPATDFFFRDGITAQMMHGGLGIDLSFRGGALAMTAASAKGRSLYLYRYSCTDCTSPYVLEVLFPTTDSEESPLGI